MQVFIIFSISRPQEVGAAIRQEFPQDHLPLQEGEWLVASDLTSREICDRLQISDGVNGNGIVVAMDAYWGRAANSIWEWVTTRKARQNGK